MFMKFRDILKRSDKFNRFPTQYRLHEKILCHIKKYF